MVDLSPVFVVVTTVGLLAGSTVTFFAVRAARRTDTRALWTLALGLGLLTVGATASVVMAASQVTASGVPELGSSAVTSLGFLVIAYSLFVGDSLP